MKNFIKPKPGCVYERPNFEVLYQLYAGFSKSFKNIFYNIVIFIRQSAFFAWNIYMVNDILVLMFGVKVTRLLSETNVMNIYLKV